MNSPLKLKAKGARGRATLMKNIFQGLFPPVKGKRVFTGMDAMAMFALVPLKLTKQNFLRVYCPDVILLPAQMRAHHCHLSDLDGVKKVYGLEKGTGRLCPLLRPADTPATQRQLRRG